MDARTPIEYPPGTSNLEKALTEALNDAVDVINELGGYFDFDQLPPEVQDRISEVTE